MRNIILYRNLTGFMSFGSAKFSSITVFVLAITSFLISTAAQVQSNSAKNDNYIQFETPDFELKLSRSSQTAVGLMPKGSGGFDFVPSDRLSKRTGNGFYELGDLRFSVRANTSESWRDFSTAANRKTVINI